MGGEKRYIADTDNTLEMFGYKEKHKNMMADGEDMGLSEGFFFLIEDTSTCVYTDGNDPDKEKD